MKIAYVLGEYPSLSETFLAREIDALRRRGFVIEIMALRAGNGARELPPLPPVKSLAKALGRFSPQARASYFRQLGTHWASVERAQLKDVQHIHAGWASFPAWIAMTAARELEVPWSFSGHARDLWVEGEGLREKILEAKFASCCTRVGTEFLQSCAPEQAARVLYAPHGIEISEYEFISQRTLHSPIRLLAVGRLVEKKGLPLLLEAVGQLSSAGQAVQLRVIGEGPLRRELEKQAATMPQGQIELVGACAHTDVVEAMHRADIFVMASREAADGDRDGLPNVLLEAAACGLPIVSTSAGATTDLLDESRAWLCEPHSASTLAQAVQAAVVNYEESLQRAAIARKWVESHFHIEKNISTLAEAFMARH